MNVPDVFTPEKRSQVMAAIRSKDTKPEIRLRSALHRMGFRFRKNDKRLPGKPDIVLPKHGAAVFVNGCFWHAHEGCKGFKMPGTRQDYWKAKFQRNRERDLEKDALLREAGWTPFTIWNCELNEADIEALAQGIVAGNATGFEAGRAAGAVARERLAS